MHSETAFIEPLTSFTLILPKYFDFLSATAEMSQTKTHSESR